MIGPLHARPTMSFGPSNAKIQVVVIRFISSPTPFESQRVNFFFRILQQGVMYLALGNGGHFLEFQGLITIS